MCIRCITQNVKSRIADNYMAERDGLIADLYTYFSVNEGVDWKDLASVGDVERLKKCYIKLQKIGDMIEGDSSQDDLLYELEILDGTMDFLQRHEERETLRKSNGAKLYD